MYTCGHICTVMNIVIYLRMYACICMYGVSRNYGLFWARNRQVAHLGMLILAVKCGPEIASKQRPLKQESHAMSKIYVRIYV